MSGAVRVGPAGWSYEDWKGVVYPGGRGGPHPLVWLAHAFDCIEVNATFYRPLPARYAQTWLEHAAANPAFHFLAKLWGRFTHEEQTPPDADERAFREGLAPLIEAGRLGAVLVQFPMRFHRTPANRTRLAAVLDRFADLPLAVEFRHDSWKRPEVLDGLRERRAAFCNIDQPLLGDCLPPTDHVTAPFAYTRLHGRNARDWFREDAGRDNRYNYLYTAQELADWAGRITAMRKRAETVYVVTNNHYRGQAVTNALQIEHAFERPLPGLPDSLRAAYPELDALAQGGAP